MQWYVRFYLGRRCEDDERQVRRCESRFWVWAFWLLIEEHRAESGGTNGYVRARSSSTHRLILVYRFAGRFSRMLMKKIAQHPGSGGAVVDNTAVEDEDVGRVLRQVSEILAMFRVPAFG
jgi:hypothetical protein